MSRGSEGPLKKLLEMEYRNINAGLVTRPRHLTDLLQEDVPACAAKDGSLYRFDRRALHEFADKLTEEEKIALRLPVTVIFQTDLPDSCYLNDKAASEVLRRLEDFGPAYRFRDGRMLMPASLGFGLIRKYGRLMQRLFLP